MRSACHRHHTLQHTGISAHTHTHTHTHAPQFRPTADLKETLLHEMIHASLFLKGVREGNGGHGPRFCAQMTAINQSSAADPQVCRVCWF
jgi:hypothetical protein